MRALSAVVVIAMMVMVIGSLVCGFVPRHPPITYVPVLLYFIEPGANIPKPRSLAFVLRSLAPPLSRFSVASSGDLHAAENGMSPLLDLRWGRPLLRDGYRAWELCTSSTLAATVHIGPIVTPLWVLPQLDYRAFSPFVYGMSTRTWTGRPEVTQRTCFDMVNLTNLTF
jgi:hypothetical protein